MELGTPFNIPGAGDGVPPPLPASKQGSAERPRLNHFGNPLELVIRRFNQPPAGAQPSTCATPSRRGTTLEPTWLQAGAAWEGRRPCKPLTQPGLRQNP